MELEGRVLNWKDEEGNTILHVSSRENNIQVMYHKHLSGIFNGVRMSIDSFDWSITKLKYIPIYLI